ncbi:MAG TPA: hypothetical protein VFK02_20495 [Kofleriaceae bacterium]|nr:hypothetical protein [Kofleriaceae bacterium]
MKKNSSGPASSARVIGLSRTRFAASAEARNTIQQVAATISEEDLRQCRGGLIQIIRQ